MLSSNTQVATPLKTYTLKYLKKLNNYQYYSQKLQEQSDKDGIANNFDLIMRNKAEEKLICEKDKVEELKVSKEKGFRRIQKENTILIGECNRLRKNLHEIYMHVVDIEQRFERLTKIKPNKPQSEIVNQIKEFIRVTHEKIKENYAKTKKSGAKARKASMNLRKISEINDRANKLESAEPTNKSTSKIISQLEENKVPDPVINEYENLIQLPALKQSNNGYFSKNKSLFDSSSSVKQQGLPQV